MTAIDFMIDGQPRKIEVNEVEDVARRASPAGLEEIVDIANVENLVRQIADAREVQVALIGKTESSHFYQIPKADLGTFRRIVALFEMPVLPDAKDLPQEVLPESPPEEAPREDIFLPGTGGVTNPKIIMRSKVLPIDPEAARRLKIGGLIALEAIVRKDGTVDSIRVLRSPGGGYGFEEAAIATARKWRYEPALRDGKPVDVYFTILVEFY